MLRELEQKEKSMMAYINLPQIETKKELKFNRKSNMYIENARIGVGGGDLMNQNRYGVPKLKSQMKKQRQADIHLPPRIVYNDDILISESEI